MAKKLNVLVLAGGTSSEYDVSIASAKEVVRHLDPKKYNALPLIITKDRWIPVSKEKFLFEKISPTNSKSLQKSQNNTVSVLGDINKNDGIDVCFLALHGKFGEDGTLQAILDFLQIPYTGSGVLASALGMDKMKSRQIFDQIGLITPKTIIVKEKGEHIEVWKKLSPPVVVKPNSQGSSIGVSIVHTHSELKKDINKALKYDEFVLVEEYLKGTEVTCGILGNEKSFALPVVEIVPKTEFFDYKAKYTPSKCDEIVPARISPILTKKVQETAIRAYEALGCKGFGRVDMIIRGRKVYVLEVNTIPGLTSASLLPKAAASAGLSFPQLLDKIIEFAI